MTGGEHAAITQQLRIDVVGHLMRAHPQAAFRAHQHEATKAFALDRVVQFEAHFVLAVRQVVHAAGHERVGALGLPAAQIDRIGFRNGRAAGVDVGEFAAALQILAHDRADLLRRVRFIGEIRRRDGELGSSDARNEDVKLGVCCAARCNQARRHQCPQA
jgi:hypothetical protein